jgi:hypothetical protein
MWPFFRRREGHASIYKSVALEISRPLNNSGFSDDAGVGET